MDREVLEREIKELERQLEEAKAARPAHDSTGLHAMKLLEIEDELSDKRKLLQKDSRTD